MRLIEFLKKLWRYILSLFTKKKKKCPIGIKESFSDFMDQYKEEPEDDLKSLKTNISSFIPSKNRYLNALMKI